MYENFERATPTARASFWSFPPCSALLRSRSVHLLEGKVCIITGGASGIGEATAKLFAKEGAKVIIADIQDELGHKLVSAIGKDAEYVHCDVTKEAQVSDAVDFAKTRRGCLDVMFNNAGILGPVAFTLKEVDMDDYEKVMAINVRGMLLGIKHASRVMIPAKKGSIICTSSTAALLGGLAGYPYTISKHAVVGLVRAAASELRNHGISVNTICPTAVDTPLSVRFFQQLIPNITAESVVDVIDQGSGFFGAKFRAEEVAKAALFLASEDARYISGHNLVLDGGLTVTKASDSIQQDASKS